MRGRPSQCLGGGFHSDGAVRLLGAQIGATLDCRGGTFVNPLRAGIEASGTALDADRAIVKGQIFLDRGFRAEGDVHLGGAQVEGQLVCTGGTFHGALLAPSTVIKGPFWWGSIRDPEQSSIFLANASADAVADDPESWPPQGRLVLDGFVYKRISDGPRDADHRMAWLQRQVPFTPQPYRQLAIVLRDSGDEEGAKKVLIEMEQRQREGQWILSPVFRWTVGYGYDPLRAFWWLGAFSAIGWLIFWRANRLKAMAPTDTEAYKLHKVKGPPPHYPRFSPLLYTVENLFPLVKFGQADKWQPDPELVVPAHPPRKWWMALLDRFAGRPHFLRALIVFLVFAGWFLAVLFAAGVTGLLRKP